MPYVTPSLTRNYRRQRRKPNKALLFKRYKLKSWVIVPAEAPE